MKVAVVGAGVVGLATAVALIERGADVTVYERGVPGHGQSGGDGRIFRHAHDDDRQIDSAVRSRRMWRTWEQRYGVELVLGTGVVDAGPAVQRRAAALEAAGVANVRVIDGARLPQLIGFAAPSAEPLLLDPSGGAIHSQATIRVLSAVVGDRLVIDDVHAVAEPSARHVQVVAGGGIERFDRVVLCAGAGTAPLASCVGIAVPSTTSAHVRFAFAPGGGGSAPARERPDPAARAVPACLRDGTQRFTAAGAYGTFSPGSGRYSVGLSRPIAASAPGWVADPVDFDRARQHTSAYVRQALPGLDPEPLAARTCWITTLPWGDDGVAVWRSGNVFALAGHNLFKLAPWLGAELAVSVIDDQVPATLEPAARLGRRHTTDADDAS